MAGSSGTSGSFWANAGPPIMSDCSNKAGLQRVWFKAAEHWGPMIGNYSQLEEACANRRYLWDVFRKARLRYGHELYSIKWREFVQEAFKDERNILGFLRDVAEQDIEQSRYRQESLLRKDVMSNIIVSIACTLNENPSKNKKYSTIFHKYELDWFVFKFMQLRTMEEIRNFFKENGISEPKQIDHQYLSKNYILSQIRKMFGFTKSEFKTVLFYQVPIDRVPRLFKNRQVFPRGGETIIPATMMFDYLTEDFIEYCSMQLRKVEKQNNLAGNVADIASNVRNILKEWLISTDPTLGYKTSKSLDKLTLRNIDEQALEYFPPCARTLHKHLQVDNHLHYHSRYQYLVFLRNAGLPVRQAQQLFSDAAVRSGRTESDSKMNKVIYYFIPWIYGLKGRLRPHMPFTCRSILDIGRHFNNCNGCPLMCNPLSETKVQLEKEKVSQEDSNSIISLIENSQHREACRVYFKSMTGHEYPNKDIVHNPNDFYNACVAIKNGALVDVEDLCTPVFCVSGDEDN